jgi:membrane protease YdiL (CAAX protease family)
MNPLVPWLARHLSALRVAGLVGAALCFGAVRVQAVLPELDAAASFFIPGLGQAANGDYGAGALQFGASLVLYDQYAMLIEKDDYIPPEDRLDNKNKTIATNRTTFYADLYGSALLDLQFYSSYSAYRDARLLLNNEGYHTPMPDETLGALALAPFRWEFLSRPTTYVALILPLLAALSPASKDQLVYEPEPPLTRDEMGRGFALQFEGVAIGEEAFFRGVLNNGLSSGFGDTWGLVGSSTAFALAHTGAPGQATPLLAGAFGLYLGWLQQRNEFQIGEGVAIHFWWDFLISLGSLAQHEQNAQLRLFTYVGRF